MLLRIALILLLTGGLAPAQQSPFFPSPLYHALDSEISGDLAYDHLRTLTQFHAPNGSGGGFWDAARWIEGRARLTGLEDIRVIEMALPEPAWTPIAGEAWLVEPGAGGKPVHTKLGSFREIATSIADNSRPTKMEAELVDVGRGTEESDYSGKDVKGKIVLASGIPTAVEEQAVWKRGALGILSYASSRMVPGDYPDQVPWTRIHAKSVRPGQEPTFAFVISYRKAQELRARLTGVRTTDGYAPGHAKHAPAGPVRVRVNIESELRPKARHGIVEGWIRGSGRAAANTPGSQQVLLTAHIQEERFSANDDRSGCSNLLELARALTRMIADGRIPRPERDIRFWWVDEISGPYHYLALHPEEREQIFLNLNQDMVGGHQTIGGLTRVQHVTLTPWSRPTFFNDVVEGVVQVMAHSNNSYLAARQAGSAALGSLYSRPIFSRMGSRDRYAVEVVPYFGNSDHLVFNDAFTAARHGGVTFIEWPDEYIHSSGDDIWQQDQTTLKRNAVAWAAMALYAASAGARDVPSVTAMVVPGALARIQQNVRAATAARLQGEATGWDVDNMAAIAVEREYAAIDSIRTLAPQDKAASAAVDQALEAFWASATSVSESLPMYSRPPAAQPEKGKSKPAVAKPPAVAAHPLQAAMQARIPVRSASIAEYRDRHEKVDPVAGLHNLMRFEALNFADGKRSLWDIYAAARAESLAAGEWYYGHVEPEMIQQLFDGAVAAGIVTWKAQTPQPARK